MREQLSSKICIATQKTNYNCNQNIKCLGQGNCAHCLVMAEELIKNNILISPCKVEDTVYVITEQRPCYACHYCTDYCHLDCIFDDKRKLVVKEAIVHSILYSKERNKIKVEFKKTEGIHSYCLEYNFSEFGKAVFLSQEEAEEHLKFDKE